MLGCAEDDPKHSRADVLRSACMKWSIGLGACGRVDSAVTTSCLDSMPHRARRNHIDAVADDRLPVDRLRCPQYAGVREKLSHMAGTVALHVRDDDIGEVSAGLNGAQNSFSASRPPAEAPIATTWGEPYGRPASPRPSD